jgi:Co/Zn/Cd efflux system component
MHSGTAARAADVRTLVGQVSGVGPVVVRRLGVHPVRRMVGVGEGFLEEALDVRVGRDVVGEGALASHADESGQPQLGQVLAHGRGAGVDQLGQAVDRGLALEERDQDLDAVLVAEHAECVGSQLHVGVVGHLEVRELLVHEVIITCISAWSRRYSGSVSTEQPGSHAPGDLHDHDGDHDADAHHGHSHGLVDPTIVRSRSGVQAVSLSLAVLLMTSVVQLAVFLVSDSVALLTDVIHNGGDALTAIPLGIAFFLRSRRGELWAGYFVVAVILASALLALFEVIDRFLHPQAPTHLWALFVAGVVGVIGNEVAAVVRWRAGKRLRSPALIADGIHARADGYVSAGIIASAAFIALGLPIADPLIGLIITGLIFHSTWESWETIRHG